MLMEDDHLDEEASGRNAFVSMASAYSLMSNSLQHDCLSVHSIMDDIFSQVLALSSRITQQLIFFIENLVQGDVERYSDDSVVFSARHHLRDHSRYSSSPYTSNYDRGSSSSGPGVCGIKYKVLQEDLLVNSGCEVIERKCNYEVVPSIFQGFMLPCFCLKLALSFLTSCWRSCLSYLGFARLHIHNIMSRVQKTLHGSGDDIGWLQCAPGMPPIKDGTARFLELLEGIRYGEHKLPNCYVYLLIPGLFSNHGPLYFVGTKRFFSKMGLACHIAKIHSEASVEHNAWELKHYIEELYWGSGKCVMLLGHSKGGVDAAAALSLYWSDLKGKVAGLALVQSPYGGTPVASDILREGQIADREIRKIMELIICKLIKGDIRALEDLTYEKRKEFILKHKLPEDIPIISFHSEASIAPSVLVTMTHIAHAELPWFRLLKFGNDESSSLVLLRGQIPVAIPVSAAMALCALHLQLRYGEKSDGLVTCRDAEVPGSVVVRPDKKLDHAWMVYSSRRKNPTDPDASEMCAAILTMLVEIGKQKKSIKTV